MSSPDYPHTVPAKPLGKRGKVSQIMLETNNRIKPSRRKSPNASSSKPVLVCYPLHWMVTTAPQSTGLKRWSHVLPLCIPLIEKLCMQGLGAWIDFLRHPNSGNFKCHLHSSRSLPQVPPSSRSLPCKPSIIPVAMQTGIALMHLPEVMDKDQWFNPSMSSVFGQSMRNASVISSNS